MTDALTTAPVKDTYVSPYRSTGSMYVMTRELNNTEVAKLIKKELALSFPNYTFKVTAPRNSINVRIIDLDYNPFSEARQADLRNDTDTATCESKRYNERYLSDYNKIDEIHGKYNYDDSDSQCDYSSTRYYGSVDLQENALVSRYYPNNVENNRSLAFHAKWGDDAKKRNVAAAQRRTDIKRGDKVKLTIARNWGYIPAGEYEAIVRRAPNGRGRIDSFTVAISLTKILRKGILVELGRVMQVNDLMVTKSEIELLAK